MSPEPEIDALTLFTLPDAWIEPDPETSSASKRSLIPDTRIVAEPSMLTALSEGPVIETFNGLANDSTSFSSTVSTPFFTVVTTCGKTSAGADTVIDVYGLIEKVPSTAPFNRTLENASVCRLSVLSTPVPALLWAIATHVRTLQITAAALRTIDTRIFHLASLLSAYRMFCAFDLLKEHYPIPHGIRFSLNHQHGNRRMHNAQSQRSNKIW
jgi:hypothetical protein